MKDIVFPASGLLLEKRCTKLNQLTVVGEFKHNQFCSDSLWASESQAKQVLPLLYVRYWNDPEEVRSRQGFITHNWQLQSVARLGPRTQTMLLSRDDGGAECH